ncbi:hypothetical protein [Variovorax ginsengisoli]|uniref:Uncharacterized protein n=1 Tax=Variovorax ginsengisoli TaxID=363844 RepID=A0ABT8SEG3_9BURK|nr:hypothetical protein [Variovorax ginsengisoli]MDN8617382.1 hypothetical protein [Variovorax ginsengisoli]MDO1536552.1 hypothetical protein [Variovorax ginsengisoli]
MSTSILRLGLSPRATVITLPATLASLVGRPGRHDALAPEETVKRRAS